MLRYIKMMRERFFKGCDSNFEVNIFKISKLLQMKHLPCILTICTWIALDNYTNNLTDLNLDNNFYLEPINASLCF